MSTNRNSKTPNRTESSSDMNTLIRNADAQANNAEKIIGDDVETFTAGRGQLIKALKLAVSAAKSYDKLIDMTTSNKAVSELDQKLRKTLATGIKINNAIVLQSVKSKIPGYDLVNLTEKLNMESEQYDDLQEVRKRVKSFEKFPCESRVLDEFPGGKQFEELLLKNFILKDIKYTNLKNETRTSIVQPILLWGPSGAGKTHLVDGIILKIQSMKEYANRKIPVFNVSGRMLIGKHDDLESTEKIIHVLFEEARKQVKSGVSVIFIEEIEYAFGTKQEKNKEVAKAINTLITECTKESNKGIVLFLTTSFPETIDYSIIDLCLNRIVYVGHPSASDIKEFFINKFKGLGVGRYHKEFNDSLTTTYTVIGDDGRSTTESRSLRGIDLSKPEINTNKSDWDILDFFAYALRSSRFLVREIDAVWLRALEYAQSRTTEFLESETQDGSTDQRWIRDERKKKTKVTDASGKCSEREVIRNAFIPVGTEGIDSLDNEERPSLADWDSKEITESKNLFRVVTRRQRNSNGKWEYSVIKEEILNNQGEKKWMEYAGREIPNFLDLVGMSQLRFDDLNTAVSSIKPVKIVNVDELINFSNRSLFVKSKNAKTQNSHDLQTLLDIQKEQDKK